MVNQVSPIFANVVMEYVTESVIDKLPFELPLATMYVIDRNFIRK